MNRIEESTKTTTAKKIKIKVNKDICTQRENAPDVENDNVETGSRNDNVSVNRYQPDNVENVTRIIKKPRMNTRQCKINNWVVVGDSQGDKH